MRRPSDHFHRPAPANAQSSLPQRVSAVPSLAAAVVPAKAEAREQELKPAHFPAPELPAAARLKVVVVWSAVQAESS